MTILILGVSYGVASLLCAALGLRNKTPVPPPWPRNDTKPRFRADYAKELVWHEWQASKGQINAPEKYKHLMRLRKPELVARYQKIEEQKTVERS